MTFVSGVNWLGNNCLENYFKATCEAFLSQSVFLANTDIKDEFIFIEENCIPEI